MKLAYTGPAREQAKAALRTAYAAYREVYDVPVEQCVYEDLSRYYRKQLYPDAEQIHTLTTLFHLIGTDHAAKARLACFVEEDMVRTQCHQQAAAKCHAMSYAMYLTQRQPPTPEIAAEYAASGYFELLEYRLIAAGEEKVAAALARSSKLYGLLFAGDVERFGQLLRAIPEDPAKPSYHISVTKPIYEAMLKRDAAAFQERIGERIRNYRALSDDQQPVVDVVTIALCKLAQRFGIRYYPAVAEVPEVFLTQEAPHRPDCRIPDPDHCEQVFRSWGDRMPGLTEIRQKLYFMEKNGRYPAW